MLYRTECDACTQQFTKHACLLAVHLCRPAYIQAVQIAFSYYFLGLNADAMKQSFYEFFGPGSDYDQEAVNKYIPKTAISGTKKFPVNGPWKNMSIKDFLKNMEEGEKALVKFATIICFLCG